VRATKHAREGGRSVYFCPLAEIVDSLARADREGRLRERIRYLCRAQLLIIDMPQPKAADTQPLLSIQSSPSNRTRSLTN
jgi:DNA replication protein DnaC